MGVRLTVKMKNASGADQTKTVLLDDDVITLGRDQTCQIVLAQQAVSRSHARISRDGTLFFVEDLGSSYGSLVNGQKLPSGEKKLLRNGDVIAIAQFDVTFDRVADVSQESGADNTSYLARKVVKDVMKGLSTGAEQAYFRVMNGQAEGRRIEIADAQEYVFGRDSADADVVLNADLVSRRHVKVRRDWSGTHLEDLGSRNGIKVNGERTRKATIKDRDEVEIGGVRLLFIDPSEVREDPVVLAADAKMSDEDDDPTHGTVSVRSEPEQEQEQEPEPQPEAEPQEASPSSFAADDADATEDENEDDDDDDDYEESGPHRIDLSNKQHLMVIGIGAAMVLVGVVLLILLFAGA